MSRIEEKQKRSYYWFINLEKLIIKMLIIIMSLLIIIQFIYMRQDIDINLNTIGNLEGKSLNDTQGYINRGTIELTLHNLPYSEKKPQILVNGEKIAVFENNSATINIKNNDIIEVSGVGIKDAFLVKLAYTSDNIMHPKANDSILIENKIVILGKAKLK